MIPESSPGLALVPKLVLQSKLLVCRVGSSCHEPTVAPSAVRVVVPHQNALGGLVGDWRPTELFHRLGVWRHGPLDLRVQEVLLLEGAERELRERLALVRHDAVVGAGLVRESAGGQACHALQAPRLSEARAELVLASVHRAADRLQGRHGLLHLNRREGPQRAIHEREHRVHSLLRCAPVPQVDDVTPQLRGSGPAAYCRAQAEGPYILELCGAGAVDHGHSPPEIGHCPLRGACDEQPRGAGDQGASDGVDAIWWRLFGQVHPEHQGEVSRALPRLVTEFSNAHGSEIGLGGVAQIPPNTLDKLLRRLSPCSARQALRRGGFDVAGRSQVRVQQDRHGRRSTRHLVRRGRCAARQIH
mmetsp:Transcript_28450/g.78376  ORF Transcript_28450/g.78376 Transcript_28450/m.78376 type:complete len:359 (+) Transcript_28450:204-1280(+)